MVDYYKILDVQRSASPTDIRKAYRRLALQWHPDKNPDQQDVAERRFKEISEAYEVLSDEKMKRAYDERERSGSSHHHRRHHHRRGVFDDNFYQTGFGFSFKDPGDVFNEFFRDNTFVDFFNWQPSTSRSSDTGFYHHFNNSIANPMGMHPNRSVWQVDPFFQPSSFPGFNVFDMQPSRGAVKKTSKSTRFINGKKIERKTVLENGIETVTVFEDCKLVSKHINGVAQPIA